MAVVGIEGGKKKNKGVRIGLIQNVAPPEASHVKRKKFVMGNFGYKTLGIM